MCFVLGFGKTHQCYFIKDMQMFGLGLEIYTTDNQQLTHRACLSTPTFLSSKENYRFLQFNINLAIQQYLSFAMSM